MASNTGRSASTCPVCVYRWVCWHRLQTSKVKKHKSYPSAQEGGFLLFFFSFNYNAFQFSCSSHTIPLKWNFVFRYKYTPCVPPTGAVNVLTPACLTPSDRERQSHHSTSLKTPLWACRGRKKRVIIHSLGNSNSQTHASLEKPHWNATGHQTGKTTLWTRGGNQFKSYSNSTVNSQTNDHFSSPAVPLYNDLMICILHKFTCVISLTVMWQ